MDTQCQQAAIDSCCNGVAFVMCSGSDSCINNALSSVSGAPLDIIVVVYWGAKSPLVYN